MRFFFLEMTRECQIGTVFFTTISYLRLLLILVNTATPPPMVASSFISTPVRLFLVSDIGHIPSEPALNCLTPQQPLGSWDLYFQPDTPSRRILNPTRSDLFSSGDQYLLPIREEMGGKRIPPGELADTFLFLWCFFF